MHKPATSHQRNYVILGQARHPINQATFFRKYFFAGASWAAHPMRTGRVKEVAVVPFDVSIEGRSMGTNVLRIDHNEQRIASQRNSPTWLNWSGLAPVIRRRNLTGRYLALERLSDGTFRLRITRSQSPAAVIPPAARRRF